MSNFEGFSLADRIEALNSQLVKTQADLTETTNIKIDLFFENVRKLINAESPFTIVIEGDDLLTKETILALTSGSTILIKKNIILDNKLDIPQNDITIRLSSSFGIFPSPSYSDNHLIALTGERFRLYGGTFEDRRDNKKGVFSIVDTEQRSSYSDNVTLIGASIQTGCFRNGNHILI